MPPLTNTRWEMFTLHWSEGMPKTEAAIVAGFKPRWAASIASRLSRKVKILARYRELQQKAEDASVATVLERKARLTEILRARLPDYQTPNGIQVDRGSPNTGAIESLETITHYSRDSHAGGVTVKRPVVPESLRNQIFDRDGHKCLDCGNTENLQIDHITPLSRGGYTVEENLQTLCETCNKRKAGGKKSQPEVITKIKLHNPITAIAELNKLTGAYPQEKERIPVEVINSFTFILPDGTQVTPKQLASGGGDGNNG